MLDDLNKAKVDPTTAQTIRRHSKILTTLDQDTQEDRGKTRAAQCEFLTCVGMKQAVQQEIVD